MTRVALAIVASMTFGCNAPADPPMPPRSYPAEKAYPFSGIVRRVDRDSQQVVVAHDPIPGFMPAMTMPLRVENAGDLDDVEPGDEIEARLVTSPGPTRLLNLVVTRPSLGPDTASDPPGPPLLEPGQEVPELIMTDQTGQPLRLSDLRGHAVVLTFVYTRCPLPEFCPAQDRKFGDLARRLATVSARAEAVRLLSVSFDPEHDTPEVLARHAARVGARPPLWRFASATHEALGHVAPALGLHYAPGSRDAYVHDLSTALIDPRGRLVRLERGGKWSPEMLLRQALDAAGVTANRASSEHGDL